MENLERRYVTTEEIKEKQQELFQVDVIGPDGCIMQAQAGREYVLPAGTVITGFDFRRITAEDVIVSIDSETVDAEGKLSSQRGYFALERNEHFGIGAPDLKIGQMGVFSFTARLGYLKSGESIKEQRTPYYVDGTEAKRIVIRYGEEEGNANEGQEEKLTYEPSGV